MRLLLHGIPLGEVSTSMTINAPAALLLLLYQLVAEEQGVPPSALTGTIQNDILKEYIARGTYIYPRSRPLRLVADTFAYCRAEIPALEHDLDLRVPHGGGRSSTRCRESHCTLAKRQADVYRTALRSGLAINGLRTTPVVLLRGPHRACWRRWPSSRAAHRLWAQDDPGGIRGPEPKIQMLRFHTQTAGARLTAQQPEVDLTRVTVQALAAVLGGTQSLHTNTYDEAIALPSQRRPGSRCAPSR